MNQYDEMSEDLTSMMIVLDSQTDRTGLKPLMKALERAHKEACKASQVLREGSNQTAETRLKLVRKVNPPAICAAFLLAMTLNVLDQLPLGLG